MRALYNTDAAAAAFFVVYCRHFVSTDGNGTEGAASNTGAETETTEIAFFRAAECSGRHITVMDAFVIIFNRGFCCTAIAS